MFADKIINSKSEYSISLLNFKFTINGKELDKEHTEKYITLYEEYSKNENISKIDSKVLREVLMSFGCPNFNRALLLVNLLVMYEFFKFTICELFAETGSVISDNCELFIL